VYNIPNDAPFAFKPYYDRIAQYRSKSTLTIPLRTNVGDILGVIQIWNKKTSDGTIVEFDSDDELMIMHFATNATVALQRAQMTRAILLRMIKMAELRDPTETGPHVNRVAGYSIEIYERYATQIGTATKEIDRVKDNLRMAAMLHDVGKVAISDTILKKPARLTDAEYEIMKTHTWQGARLFLDKQSEFDEVAQAVAFSHHENWDGTGYPGLIDMHSGKAQETDSQGRIPGRRGDEIPLFGRIVAFADVFDALRSHRVYKESWSEEASFAEMRKLAGYKFDPDILDCFFDVLPSIRTIQEKYRD
jgi:HD-GYP domain-containing protein (c-di-GMP phosphodiesterase class II)